MKICKSFYEAKIKMLFLLTLVLLYTELGVCRFMRFSVFPKNSSPSKKIFFQEFLPTYCGDDGWHLPPSFLSTWH